MIASVSDIDSIYREREQRFAHEAERLEARARFISNLRPIAFLGILSAPILPAPQATWIGAARIALFAGFSIAFLALAVYQTRLTRKAASCSELAKINSESRLRLARKWDALPYPKNDHSDDAEHPYASELDLFGHASLFTLLGTVSTSPGVETLENWLLEPAEPQVVRGRQAAVIELAPLLEARQQISLRGRLAAKGGTERLKAFLTWADGEPWLSPKTSLVWLTRLLPVFTLSLIALNIVGLVSYTAWAFALILSLAVRQRFSERLEGTVRPAFAGERSFQSYAEILSLMSGEPFEAAALKRIQAQLSGDGEPAHRWMERLQRIGRLVDAGDSMLGIVLQALLMWDFHVVFRLEKWQKATGSRVRGWFAAMGEFEALAALGELYHDNPSWSFPEVDKDAAVLEAKELGHPLLSDDVRVANDVEVGPPGTFLMITGSNMSGKSTLLRAIGMNATLAQAGGPVCASSLRMPPLRLQTTMRVHDSLEQGLSHFMAELVRLKAVVDAARKAREESRVLLYLLDDVLQGTNTAERRIAARAIVEHLISEGAIGAVTTHDLELAETDGLSRANNPFYFTETVEKTTDGPRLSFDYKLRPGIATSRNALKLLQIVNLDVATLKPET
ncbi:MAG: hypothetical protein V3U63_11165 [Gemmatimonadota bacterium]